MSVRGAPAAGATAGAVAAATATAPPPDDTWLAARLQALGVPLRGARLCVAYSGGADSTALLVMLAGLRRRWRLQLRAVHVDHAMVPGSAARARRARALARSLGVGCKVLRRPVVVARRASPEAEARRVRYQALRAALAADEWLLLAHQADDQLETVLLQLLRGAGPAGLAASPARAGRELRPLLPLRRAALVALLEARGIGCVDDPSNADTRFDRNYLRHELLPRLLARWPGAPGAVARSAQLAAEAAAQLDERANGLLDRAREGRALRVVALRALDEPARRLLLRRWLQWAGLPPPGTRALRELAGPLLAARDDAQPVVSWPGGTVQRRARLLHAQLSETPRFATLHSRRQSPKVPQRRR